MILHCTVDNQNNEAQNAFKENRNKSYNFIFEKTNINDENKNNIVPLYLNLTTKNIIFEEKQPQEDVVISANNFCLIINMEYIFRIAIDDTTNIYVQYDKNNNKCINGSMKILDAYPNIQLSHIVSTVTENNRKQILLLRDGFNDTNGIEIKPYNIASTGFQGLCNDLMFTLQVSTQTGIYNNSILKNLISTKIDALVCISITYDKSFLDIEFIFRSIYDNSIGYIKIGMHELMNLAGVINLQNKRSDDIQLNNKIYFCNERNIFYFGDNKLNIDQFDKMMNIQSGAIEMDENYVLLYRSCFNEFDQYNR